MLLLSEIEKIKSFLATQPVVKAFIVGSVARNEETQDSDVDLLIELDRQAKVGLMKFASIKFELENILQKKIDLLSEGGISKYVLPSIIKDKKLIYEKRA